MSSFSISFSMAILHSLWQAALLYLIFQLVNKIFIQKISPLDKRNFLFVTLLAQSVLFIVTFFIYFISSSAAITETGFSSITNSFFSLTDIAFVTPWLCSIYMAVIVFKLLKAIYTWHLFKALNRKGLQKPVIDLKLFTISKAHQFGIKRKVQLWFSTTISTPITFGFFKPVILLPVALVNQISTQQAETLILHELTHIRVNDYLLNWFLVIIENVFFFNPFVLSLSKKIRMEREKYCDLSVMAFNYSPAMYAETLLLAERIKKMTPSFQLAAVQQKALLLQRIRFFTSGNQLHQQNRYGFVMPVFALLMFTLIFSAAVLRSKEIVTPAALSSTSLYGIPAVRFEFDNTTSDYTEIPAIKNTPFHTIIADFKKQQPGIEKQLKKLKPSLQLLEANAEKFVKDLERNFITPVMLKEVEPDQREVIIKEETSGSKAVAIKVYQMIMDNGRWVMVPQWIATAKEVLTDTLQYMKKDGRVKKIIPPQ